MTYSSCIVGLCGIEIGLARSSGYLQHKRFNFLDRTGSCILTATTSTSGPVYVLFQLRDGFIREGDQTKEVFIQLHQWMIDHLARKESRPSTVSHRLYLQPRRGTGDLGTSPRSRWVLHLLPRTITMGMMTNRTWHSSVSSLPTTCYSHQKLMSRASTCRTQTRSR